MSPPIHDAQSPSNPPTPASGGPMADTPPAEVTASVSAATSVSPPLPRHEVLPAISAPPGDAGTMPNAQATAVSPGTMGALAAAAIQASSEVPAIPAIGPAPIRGLAITSAPIDHVNGPASTQTAATISITTLPPLTGQMQFPPEPLPPLQPAQLMNEIRNVVSHERAPAEPSPTSRRTGPLSAQQRERAALIRRLGACSECRRRRVACHPSHHDLTWEEAARKYRRSHSPSLLDINLLAAAPASSPGTQNGHLLPLAPAGTTPKSTVTSHPPRPPIEPSLTMHSLEMELDTPAPSRSSRSRVRSPNSEPVVPPTLEPIESSLPSTISSFLERTGTCSGTRGMRGRYSAVQVVMLRWSDEKDAAMLDAAAQLAHVFRELYHYDVLEKEIPGGENARSTNRSPRWWLLSTINEFAGNEDSRDVLKILYYCGESFLTRDGVMVLASSKTTPEDHTIRWPGLQEAFEQASSDTLLLLATAYHPPVSPLTRHRGVLEVIATDNSSTGTSFTRALTETLRQASTTLPADGLTGCELHARVLGCGGVIHVAGVGKGASGTVVLGSLKSPVETVSVASEGKEVRVDLSVTVDGDRWDEEAFMEWMRKMPAGVKTVGVQGPWKNRE